MCNTERGRESGLPERLLGGSESAYLQFDRVFRERLCALVEKEMNGRYRRREDPEDVVQSVFRTFFRHAAEGKFQFNHTGALWKLLQTITRRKILKHVGFHQAQGRDIGKEECFPDEQMPAHSPTAHEAQVLGDALEAVLAGLETPEPELFRLQLYGYTVAEVVEIVLKGLESPYPEILQMRLQGCTESQIAARLDCGREAVRYKLRRIQERLAHLLADGKDR